MPVAELDSPDPEPESEPEVVLAPEPEPDPAPVEVASESEPEVPEVTKVVAPVPVVVYSDMNQRGIPNS